ncbi:hypothetical protein COB72_05050 [bacterium]|nr:MAG: hypothetical protein COB72_05050 [bacterium]
MNRTPFQHTMRPLTILALAGTIAVLPACGAKRAGFWNKNKQSQLQQEQARNELAQGRTSTYFVANTEPTEFTQLTPSHSTTLQSNSSASLNSQPIASSFTPPAYQAPYETNTFSASTAAPAPTNTFASNDGFTPDNQSTGFDNSFTANSGSSSASTNTDPDFEMQLGNADAPNPVKRAPYFTDDKASPAALRSGDISAFVYANAMGVELPSETNGDATRATINVRQVTSSYAGSDFDPIVTPDGRHLIFASTQHRPTADLYIKSVNGSVVTRLTDDPAQDVMPAISPDGNFITFASDRSGTWDLYIMPFEGGKVVQLTNGSANDLHPTWSPDGTQIAFCRLGQQSGRWEIWIKDVIADTGSQFIGFGLFPDWCPVAGTGIAGADQILFQRSRERGDRAFSIWTLDYNPNPGTASRETEIATAPNQALINPSWSPDGKFITFAAVPNSESWSEGTTARPDSSTIWMVSTRGTGKIKLTNGDTIDLMPVWGRNNDIYFVSNMDGQDHLWSMELSPAIRAASVMMPNLAESFATFPTENQTGN